MEAIYDLGGLRQGSRGSTSPRHRRRSERAPTKTFSKMIHRLKEDVRSWYELHRRNGATNVVVWAIYLELLLMLVLLVLLPFDTVQVGGRYRLIKPLNFTMSMAMYLATVRAIPAVRYKRYQIHGARHRGDTEKTYESYGRVT
jgi:hypothetical protein